ncbi:MAG TPA: N-acetylmuramoyl-L-alanine amidase [Methylomirabilota bacterium]|nr:N-acetylmuramoyl-L-alanine amidase [Methylomirabilota bacterium]
MRPVRLLLALGLAALAGTALAAPPTVTLEGREYVELARAAEVLKARVDASPEGVQAQLKAPGHVITVTRNWSRILVDGVPVTLDAPVRVRQGVWLVPGTFLAQVLPRVQSATAAAGTPALRAAPPPPPVALEELRFRSYPSFTRIVLETASPLSARVEASGGKEARVRLIGLAAEPRTEEIGDGFIQEARLERAGADAILNIVFEGAAGEVKSSFLADPPRLVLDVMRPVEPVAPRDRAGRPGVAPLRVLVLDAGHGGHDSGAVGPGGLQEKDLVLDVTRRVARLLEDKLDVKVRLSRDADQFVALRDRTSFANKERADLFVSIHANAHPHAASAGVETYFLSSEATDSTARQVAALENSVVQLEKTAGRSGNGRLDAVKAILWDLAQSEFQLESSRLAEVVQDSMTQSLRIPNRGVKQAGFYVLGGAAMPAILIEIGFVTNPKEERRLKDSKYRDDIARAIFAGLAEYKKKYDARGRETSPSARAPRDR